MITFIASFCGLLLLLVGFGIGYSFIQNIQFSIGILISMVPEGLPITITVSLSIAAQKLSKLKVLVKNLESVETLGSTSCICSDKTGTLTQNVMTVEHLWINNKIIRGVNLESLKDNDALEYDLKDQSFNTLRQCAVMNSTAVFTLSLPNNVLD